MREKMLGRWAIRLVVAGALGFSAFVLGVAPVGAVDQPSSDTPPVPAVVSEDPTFTTPEAGPVDGLTDIVWT